MSTDTGSLARTHPGHLGSLRGKLTTVILATIGGALLTMAVALLYRDLTEYRASLEADITTSAGIMALLAGPSLAFDDPEAAQRNLAALSESPVVRAAALYTARGEQFARYAREGGAMLPQTMPVIVPGVRTVGDGMQVVRPVLHNGELLGAVLLDARYDVWSHVHAYIGILALMILLSLGVALALAARLRQRITGPVEALAQVADDIVSRRDPGRRAPQMPLEEFAVVARAFNSVLDESEERTRALRRSERLYRAIGESIDYGVWVTDAAGRVVYVSESFLKLIGRTLEEVSALGWTDALHPDEALATVEAWMQCVATGGSWYREHRFRGADGHYHPILAQGVPIRDDAGNITGWAGINLDIARMKQTEEALRAADRRKDDFLATLAHELRNPLAPIRHAARLLQMNGLDEAQLQGARDIIGRQVARMALLLDDLLDVSRITRGRLELRKERVTVASLVRVAVETSRPLIEEKKHELEIDLPAADVEMDVDPLRLSQALSNLLTNAAKYTDPGGRITLLAQCVGDDVEFCVQDTGIGLPRSALPTMFEMFSQLDSAIDRSQGGLGIGLALVKGLVLLHGGSVQADSAGPGKGSTFTIRVPRGRPLAAADPGQPAASERAGARQCGRILVVDDNVDSATSLAMVLNSAGHIALTANGGEEGLALGGRLEPDVVLLDIGMPDLNGYDVARRVRVTPWGRNALLIALTGWGQKEDVAKARGAGFDFHMTKPADTERIEQLVEEFLGSRAGIRVP